MNGRDRSLNYLALEAFENAANKGFHEYRPKFGAGPRDARHILSALALIHSEVSEATEAVRKNDPVNFAEELADIIIRTLDTAVLLGINIEIEVMEKMLKNRERPAMHGGKCV